MPGTLMWPGRDIQAQEVGHTNKHAGHRLAHNSYHTTIHLDEMFHNTSTLKSSRGRTHINTRTGDIHQGGHDFDKVSHRLVHTAAKHS